MSSDIGSRLPAIECRHLGPEPESGFIARLRETGGRIARDCAVASCHVLLFDGAAWRILAAHGPDELAPPTLTALMAGGLGDGPTVLPTWNGRFVAAAPLNRPGSALFGALVVSHPVPRPHWTEATTARLALYADLVAELLNQQAERLALLNERAVLASGPVGALIWRAERALPLVFSSQNLPRILGPDLVERMEAGASLETLIHPEDRTHFRLTMLGHLEGGLEKSDLSFRITLPDGATRWVRQSCVTPDLRHTRDRLLFAYLADETAQKRQDQASTLLRQRLSVAVEAANIGIYDLDLAMSHRVIDDRICRMLGYAPGELDSAADSWWERVHPMDRERILRVIQEVGSWREVIKLEYRIRCRDNRYIWVQSFGKVAEFFPDGRPRRVIGTLLDVTERKRDDMLRAKQQQLLEVLNRAQASFMFTHDLQEACDGLFEPLLRVTDSAYGFIGVVRTTPEGAPYLLVPTISDLSWDEETRALYKRHLHEGGLQFHHLQNLFGRVILNNEVIMTNRLEGHSAAAGLPPGHPPLDNFLGLPLRFGTSVVGMIGLANTPEGYDGELVSLLEPLVTTLGSLIHALDVEVKRQRTERELERHATTDSLTGLLNRRQFEETGRHEVALAMRNDAAITVAILDLDHFKVVNDTHGHAGGDAVLKAFAERLRKSLRASDLVCRFGGEEFAVLMPLTSSAEAWEAMERLRVMMESTPVSFRGRAVSVTLSVGLAEARGAGIALGKLLNTADKALYLAKSSGRNQVRLASGDSPSIRLVRG